MANRKNKAVDRERCKPSMALNAVCPYYTMFSLSFPISVLGRFEKKKLRVADPFCGRGTTIFAARLKGHQAYGIDASPIASFESVRFPLLRIPAAARRSSAFALIQR
jgi:hypothetical protein